VLTGLIAALMVLAALGVLLIVIIRPEVLIGPVVSSLFDTLKVIVGAVVGYAAGYATVISSQGRAEIETTKETP